jgi:hypothetical protein
VYGSIPTPIACGSGGGDYTGGAGGGAVRLSVTGTLRIDGLLSVAAPAANTEDGGGAGGSLWIDATGLTGSGVLTAAGGASASSGGGAGGRIALYLTSNAFAGSLTAAGGSCYASGGPGTIYTQLVGAAVAQVVIDNGGSSGLTRLNQTLWPVGQSFDLLLAGMAHLRPTEPLSFTSLSMAGGALISHEQATAGFHLTTSGNVSIPAGCAINVSGLGPLAGQGAGPGARHPWGWGSGAGHGGKGQDWSYTSGGLPYGSATQPVTLGSGGGDGYGGSGGGAVRLSVGGSLLLDGTITANGNPPGGGGDDGGGSGGSIWLTADSLAGAGWLTADGGASISGGNGAGGRIAVYAYDRSGFNPAQISAIGPGDAGEGSVFLTVPLSQPTCHRVGDNVQLEWRAGTGVLYQVQTTTTLTTNDWHNFGNPIPGINGMLSVPCPIGADPRRFYRVGLSP